MDYSCNCRVQIGAFYRILCDLWRVRGGSVVKGSKPATACEYAESTNAEHFSSVQVAPPRGTHRGFSGGQMRLSRMSSGHRLSLTFSPRPYTFILPVHIRLGCYFRPRAADSRIFRSICTSRGACREAGVA